MRHDQYPVGVNPADGLPSRLAIDHSVLKHQCARITKSQGSFLKAHSVFGTIRVSTPSNARPGSNAGLPLKT